MTLEELKVVITAETAGLQSQLNQVQSQVSKMTKSVTNNTNKISNAFKNIFRGVTFTVIIAGLARFGKAAIQAASDLEEVQNVVDVAFGSMSGEVQKFAENAIYQFGISELQAKQLASTFKAMSNSLGLSSTTSKDMALTLTGLAADMSSFYNVSLESAQTALEGIYTGQTRALKQYGVVLTEATLEEFRLAKGISTAYSAMTEAEKVQLRYQYVMQATANAQGDYARTSQSWANQIRLLQNQIEQLKVELGSILIAVLKPILITLNELIAKMVKVAAAIRQVFGIKKESFAVAGAAEDTATGYEDAVSAAKELKKTLAGFDELNILSSQNTTETSEIGSLFEETTPLGDSDTAEETEAISDSLVESITKVKEILTPLWDTVKEIWDNLKKLFNELKPVIDVVLAVITIALQGVLDELNYMITVVTEVVAHIKEIFGGIVDFIAGIFTQDWSRAWDGVKNIFKGCINLIITIFEGFLNIMPAGINGVIKGINNIISKVGSKIGLNIQIPEISKVSIPRLANGGIIDSPTLALMGEYSGAKNNPEIVTPQSLLKETIESSNNNLVNAFSQMTRQIIASIEDKNMEVTLDGTTIAKSVSNANNAYRRMTGTPLIA